eukprot:7910728-Heterocapsa_arctica.AAC.1
MEQSSLLAAGAPVVLARAGRTGEDGVAVVDGCAGGLAEVAASGVAAATADGSDDGAGGGALQGKQAGHSPLSGAAVRVVRQAVRDVGASAVVGGGTAPTRRGLGVE